MSPVPTGTYRVQLTAEHGFDALAALAPHLHRLGVSHAYLSPVLQATPGSAHGYDVTDHTRVSSELGGLSGLRAAAAQLRAAGIGIVVDVVPNHMALTRPETLNRALWEVLRDGPESAYGGWFDVDWSGPLLLPVLGRRIDECLDAGEITVDPVGGPRAEPVLRYHDHVLPVRAGTADLPLEQLLDAQHYRLAYWRVADEELTYRRFFDVDTLVAVRVEDPDVFAATHQLLLGLVADGTVEGLRIDHPDGLTDPAGYLRRLAAATDRCWIVVEKVLVGDEDLPADWDCAGTTGYEALARLGGLFVDPAGAAALATAFTRFTGVTQAWGQVRETARREVLTTLLVAEVDRLAGLAHAVCQQEVRLRDHSRRGLTEAVQELLVQVPVYRAYARPGWSPSAETVAILAAAAERAARQCPDRAAEVTLVRDLALGVLGRSVAKDEFCVRFQQTTGPAMAKGVEDTASYRWFPLAGLCEVGAEPDRFGASPVEVARWAERRRRRHPHGLTATSTHDTKRSEDVRARLAVLSEIPDEWAAAVAAWQDRVGRIDPAGPDHRLDWLAWQTLVGAWPIDAGRLRSYLVKAAREAKLRTSWVDPDEAYEQRLSGFADRVTGDPVVADTVAALLARLWPGFVANVLGQRLAALATVGVPDVYQGCEVVDLSLVDPDNRRPVDLSRVTAALDRGLAAVPDPGRDLDAAKARLTAVGLRLRRDRPDLLGADAPHEPVHASGPASRNVLAFRRGRDVVAVATRFALRLADSGGWHDTRLGLPAGRWQCLLTEQEHVVRTGGLPVATLLGTWPVALLVRAEAVDAP